MSKQRRSHPYETFGIEDTLDAVHDRREVSACSHDHDHAESNDHLASLYDGQQEQFETVVPFIQQGLERGERCLYVADDNSKEEVLNALREGGIDVEAALDSGALSIHSKSDTYLRTGSFEQDAMLDFWQETLAEARDEDGYAGIRAAAEMTWALEEGTSLDSLVRYEAMLNTIYPGEDYVVLCQYNRERFPTEVISDVIRSHPLVVYNGTICQNFYYHSPDEFFGDDHSVLDVDRTIEGLVSRARTQHALQESEQELRSQVHQQRVVTELSQHGLEVQDLDSLLADATEQVADTLDADYCMALELLPDGEELLLREGVGWQDGSVGTTAIGAGRTSQAGYTLLAAGPVIVEDLATDDRFSGSDLLTTHDVTSGISVNIGPAEDPWGTLGVHTCARRDFSEHDVAFVQSVANTLASAIENDQTQSELEEMYGRISDAFFALDEDWNFTYLNERAHELINPEDRELVGKHISDAYPKTASRKFKEKSERAMSTQEPVSFEEYYSEPIDAWLEVRAYPSETGLSIYFQDITERKERERFLEDAKAQLEAAAEAGTVGTWEWHILEDRMVTGASFAKQFGVDPDAAREGVSLDQFISSIHEADREHVRAKVKAAVESCGEYEAEYRVWNADGGLRWVVARGHVECDSDGNPITFPGALTDITDRKEYQCRLEESNERLEQFAHAASHDLQEPLRMVSSYLQLIERRYSDSFDEEGHEFLEFAVNGADRMREMIDGLLTYSRVETRGDPFEPVDLGVVVEDVLDDLQFKIEDCSAEITVGALSRVEADASQLRQLFQNLLDNAIQYSGDDPPRVHISAEQSGSNWIISVHDDGIGMDPDETDRIFRVFQRLHTREEYPGTGIGLALCERIVERHNGEIWVESARGEGSTFMFTLPAANE